MAVGDLYELTWIDANSENGQHTRRELPKLERVRTYGVLVAEDKDSYTITGEVLESHDGGEENYRGSTIVPKVWGVKLRRLYRKGES